MKSNERRDLMEFLNKLKDGINKRNIKKLIPIEFEVSSWGEYIDNISKWQKEYARDQWIDAKYSSKPLYQYSWMSNIKDIRLTPEPRNKHDKNAIEIYLGDYKIGYVPRPLNEQYYKELIKSKEIKADIHGGNSKCIDAYGDLIVDKRDPIVKITILI
jgi:hypothetical protein